MTFPQDPGHPDSTAPAASKDDSKGDSSGGVGKLDGVADGGAGAQAYTVQKGDTLARIAQKHYGNTDGWQAIFDANRDQLDDPGRISPGQVLKLPDAIG